MHDPTPPAEAHDPDPQAESAPDVGPAATGGDPPVLEPTGDAHVDEVLALVDDLRDRPVGDHVATYEEAHRRLRAVLDGQDSERHGSDGRPGASDQPPTAGPTG